MTSSDRRLLMAIVATTTVISTTFLISRPVPLPSWVPGGRLIGNAGLATDSRRAAGDPPRSVLVVAGDSSIRVSWASDGVSTYRADAVRETGNGPPLPCRTVQPSAAITTTCVVSGLSNGASYLVSLHTANGDNVSTPLRTVRAVPRPEVLSSPDTIAWLDASDNAAVGPQGGGQAVIGATVATLRDESPHHRDATQSDPVRRPTLGQLGVLPALRFNGADVLLIDGRGFPAGSRPSTVLAVAAQDDDRPDASCFHNLLAWGVAQTAQARIIHKGCHDPYVYADTFNTFASQQPTRIWPTGQAAVISAIFDARGTTVRVNEIQSYRWVATPATRMNTGTAESALVGGASWDPLAGWKGRIGEVVVVDRVLSPAEITAVEGYLATKWLVSVKPGE